MAHLPPEIAPHNDRMQAPGDMTFVSGSWTAPAADPGR